jgi:FRG domain protein
MPTNNTTANDSLVTKIDSLNDFIQTVEELTKDCKKARKEIFYRGHAQYTYKNVASIFRDGNLLDYEDKLFNDTVVENHAEFINDPTALEKLVKMQHFGMPTRLMDISSSPYVGLYFACNAHADIDGEVVIFAVPEDDIEYYNSDKVAILSNLCKLGPRKKINSDELHHLIQEERMNFPENNIEYDHLSTVLCVKTKKNNDRIIKQEGAFCLFGLSLYEAQKKINQKWLLPQRILIDKEAKKGILDELQKKDIDWNTLFPDEKRIYETLGKYIGELIVISSKCSSTNKLNDVMLQLIDILKLVIMRSLCIESIDTNCDERLNILKDIHLRTDDEKLLPLQNDLLPLLDEAIKDLENFKTNANLSYYIEKIETYIRKLEENPYISYSEDNKAVIDNLNQCIAAIDPFIARLSSKYSGELKKILDTISEKLGELQPNNSSNSILQDLQNCSLALKETNKILHELFNAFLKELPNPLAEELKSIGELLKCYTCRELAGMKFDQTAAALQTIGNQLIELSSEMKNTKEVFRHNLKKIKQKYQSEIAFR